MKAALITTFIVIAAFIVWFFVLGVMSKSGKAAGLVDGKLSRCPATPNCVCTEFDNDGNHFIEPIGIPQNDANNPLPVLQIIIRELGGTIQTEHDNYLAATFTSAIFGFVDDLEIRIDTTQHVIHIRSASRVGHGDMGVNRKRVELFKKLFVEKTAETRQRNAP